MYYKPFLLPSGSGIHANWFLNSCNIRRPQNCNIHERVCNMFHLSTSFEDWDHQCSRAALLWGFFWNHHYLFDSSLEEGITYEGSPGNVARVWWNQFAYLPANFVHYYSTCITTWLCTSILGWLQCTFNRPPMSSDMKALIKAVRRMLTWK